MMSGGYCVIGTAGHVDHGKTALVRALTGIDTDRLAEEKRRGVTIETGFAWLELPDGSRAAIVDVPGHEKFIRNMLAGAGGVDLALFVVAADEGVMPQTREHLGILSLLGVTRGVIALTKTDLADAELCALAAADIRAAAAGTFLENAPLFPVSSRTGDGLEALRRALFDAAAAIPARKAGLPFRLSVDRVFQKAGFGTVVTGTVCGGSVGAGDTAAVYPTGALAKIRGVQVHGAAADRAFAGQRAALNLTGVERETLSRGCVIAAPDSVPVTDRADVELRLLPDAAFAVKNGSRLHFYCGACETLCRVLLFGTALLCAGETAFAQLRFDTPRALAADERFVLRFYSPTVTIGGGIVRDPLPPKRHRADPTLPAQLARLSSEAPAERLEEIARTGGVFTAAELALRLALSPEELSGALAALCGDGALFPLGGGRYLHRETLAALGAKARLLLARFHTENPLRGGMPLAALRQKLWHGEDVCADALLTLLARELFFERDATAARLPGFTRVYSSAQARVRDALLIACREGGFSPPDLAGLRDRLCAERALAAEFDTVLASLIEQGLLVATDERTCFAREAFDAALRTLAALEARGGAVSAGGLRDALGSSRRYVISLLDYCDRRGITRKWGDFHTLSSASPFSVPRIPKVADSL